jgi:trimethylamine:corrinoid methyltransferase-like protein
MDGHSHDNWKVAGGKTYWERAWDKVEEILRTHRPPDLGQGVQGGFAHSSSAPG